MALTFAIRVICWSRPTSHLSTGVLASSTAELKLFSTKGHGDLNHDICPQWHLLVRTNIPSKFEGPSPRHCQINKRFSTKGPGDLDLCPFDRLLVRTNISTKFEGRIISFFGTKDHGDLDLKGHLLFRSILPISLIVLGLIIADGILLYVKQVTPHLWAGPLFTPGA